MVRCFHEKMLSMRSQLPWQTEGRVVEVVLAVGTGEAGGSPGEGNTSLPHPHPHHSQHQQHPLLQERSERTTGCFPPWAKAPGGETPTLHR